MQKGRLRGGLAVEGRPVAQQSVRAAPNWIGVQVAWEASRPAMGLVERRLPNAVFGGECRARNGVAVASHFRRNRRAD
jgi:hypothetical protein